MFSYYGAKTRIIHLYPPPKYRTVIEPFAGSARYALRYFDREVILIEKYDRVVSVWKWLQSASERDILGLPDVPANLDTFQYLSRPELDFLGFNWMPGNMYPGIKIGSLRSTNAEYWQKTKRKTAKSLYKIRHWDIRQDEYFNAPDINATWFVDPPYQVGGKKYKWGTRHLDFAHLRQWIEARAGQVIVCENEKADWMQFRPLVKNQGAQHTGTMEVIWTNQNQQLATQLSLL